MQELEKLINIYHTGFIVCLVLTCVFFAVSVFFFFKFDIRKIIDMKTGRGAKKTIQKMEEINAKTGKLRQEMAAHTPSVLRAEERIAYPITSSNLQENPKIQESAGGDQATTILQQTSLEKEALREGNLQEADSTTVLQQNMPEVKKEPERKLPGLFRIEKEIMWIHTEEVL